MVIPVSMVGSCSESSLFTFLQPPCHLVTPAAGPVTPGASSTPVSPSHLNDPNGLQMSLQCLCNQTHSLNLSAHVSSSEPSDSKCTSSPHVKQQVATLCLPVCPVLLVNLGAPCTSALPCTYTTPASSGHSLAQWKWTTVCDNQLTTLSFSSDRVTLTRTFLEF